MTQSHSMHNTLTISQHMVMVEAAIVVMETTYLSVSCVTSLGTLCIIAFKDLISIFRCCCLIFWQIYNGLKRKTCHILVHLPYPTWYLILTLVHYQVLCFLPCTMPTFLILHFHTMLCLTCHLFLPCLLCHFLLLFLPH